MKLIVLEIKTNPTHPETCAYNCPHLVAEARAERAAHAYCRLFGRLIVSRDTCTRASACIEAEIPE